MLMLLVLLATSLLHPTAALFKCPSDGHWVDPDSCASYYHCANGRVGKEIATTMFEGL